jgi:DNA-binding transcriptional LysR family regulator
MNWDDARIILSVARHRSFAGAAAELRIDETTIARRLKRFEKATQSRIFIRRETHQTPTESGAAILRQAERLEVEAARLENMSRNSIDKAVTRVRLTTTAPMARYYISPHLSKLREIDPDITLALHCTDQNLSFSRWETDIAVRLSRPDDGRLVMRKLADLSYSVFGPSDPERARDLRARPNDWIALPNQFSMLPYARYVADQLKGHQPVLVSDEVDVLADAVAQGMGRAVLADQIGRRHSGVRRLHSIPGKREAWLLIHPELRDLVAIRRVADWLIQIFGKKFTK